MSSRVLFSLIFVAIVYNVSASVFQNEKTNGIVATSRMMPQEKDDATKTRIEETIEQVSSWQTAHTQNRPFVTLTYAQSLDGKIAVYLDNHENGTTSSNFPISGPESLLMTHALRSIHDAILVGGRTLVIDNPRLSNRLWAASSGVHQQQPRPVVLDTDLKYIRSLGDSCRAKNIIVCCSNDAAAASDCQDISQTVTILPCRVQEDGTIDLSHVLIELKKLGIKSLLVEGGAKVLSAFASKNLVDCLAVTISPKLLGDKGLPAFSNVFLDTNRQLDSPRFFPLGDDCILLSRWFGVNQCAD